MKFTFARSNNILLFVEVVLVALDMAAATLQGWRRPEDVPQRLGAGLTVGREMIQRGDELVAFVWETVGLVALRDRLHVSLFPALPLIGIENLSTDTKRKCLVTKPSIKYIFLRLSTTSCQTSEINSDERPTWNILGISSVSARYTSPCVTGLT